MGAAACCGPKPKKLATRGGSRSLDPSPIQLKQKVENAKKLKVLLISGLLVTNFDSRFSELQGLRMINAVNCNMSKFTVAETFLKA